VTSREREASRPQRRKEVPCCTAKLIHDCRQLHAVSSSSPCTSKVLPCAAASIGATGERLVADQHQFSMSAKRALKRSRRGLLLGAKEGGTVRPHCSSATPPRLTDVTSQKPLRVVLLRWRLRSEAHCCPAARVARAKFARLLDCQRTAERIWMKGHGITGRNASLPRSRAESGADSTARRLPQTADGSRFLDKSVVFFGNT
jgi:hypothetical protein